MDAATGLLEDAELMCENISAEPEVKSYAVHSINLALRDGTSPKQAVQILKRWARQQGYSVGRVEMRSDSSAWPGWPAIWIYGEYIKAVVPRFRKATADQLLSGELIEGHVDWREIDLAQLRQQGESN